MTSLISTTCVGLASLLSYSFGMFNSGTPFALFYVAVLVSTRFGGFLSGALATVLTVLPYGYLSPVNTPFALTREVITQMVTFGFVGLLISWLSAAREGAVGALRAEEGKYRLLEGAAYENVVRRKQAEEYLERERRWFKVVLDNVETCIVACDEHGTLSFFNRAARQLHGAPAERLPPEEWAASYDLYYPDGKTRLRKEDIPLVRAYAGERVSNVEILIAPKDGRPPRNFLVSGHAVVDGRGHKVGAVVAMQDVTDLKLAEAALKEKDEQLWQAQKLEALGRLAGGVAHDFNNLLTVITGYSEMLIKRMTNGRERAQAEEIKKAAEHASSLTRQLLAFSRRQVMQPKLIDLGALVTDISNMLRSLVPKNVELILTLREGVGLINADPTQIMQVLVNLVVNARDAMPAGGKLTVETADAELDGAYDGIHIAGSPGRYVMLAVSDTGQGIDEETKRRIFEPFFTTKELGKGTGLGLSTVYGIVKQSGGYISVSSEPGKGASFKVYFPRAGGGPGSPASGVNG